MSAQPSKEPRTRYGGLPNAAVHHIATLFGTEAQVEPYTPEEGTKVYALRFRGPSGSLRLLCWPSLQRVDVTCGPHTWIARSIRETEIIDGLEVIFRFKGGGTLFVALTGDVLMVGEAPQRTRALTNEPTSGRNRVAESHHPETVAR